MEKVNELPFDLTRMQVQLHLRHTSLNFLEHAAYCQPFQVLQVYVWMELTAESWQKGQPYFLFQYYLLGLTM
jgi:hypothetical protein